MLRVPTVQLRVCAGMAFPATQEWPSWWESVRQLRRSVSLEWFFVVFLFVCLFLNVFQESCHHPSLFSHLSQGAPKFNTLHEREMHFFGSIWYSWGSWCSLTHSAFPPWVKSWAEMGSGPKLCSLGGMLILVRPSCSFHPIQWVQTHNFFRFYGVLELLY